MEAPRERLMISEPAPVRDFPDGLLPGTQTERATLYPKTPDVRVERLSRRSPEQPVEVVWRVVRHLRHPLERQVMVEMLVDVAKRSLERERAWVALVLDPPPPRPGRARLSSRRPASANRRLRERLPERRDCSTPEGGLVRTRRRSCDRPRPAQSSSGLPQYALPHRVTFVQALRRCSAFYPVPSTSPRLEPWPRCRSSDPTDR